MLKCRLLKFAWKLEELKFCYTFDQLAAILLRLEVAVKSGVNFH